MLPISVTLASKASNRNSVLRNGKRLNRCAESDCEFQPRRRESPKTPAAGPQ